ncbi:MAG: hypothetical protein V7K69_18175 [Nostoc sp.]|uniref:hypothetical protein n=1 Tax=Nostoc sp. TaxID=1180 RepID=UPI002FFAAB04
MFVFIVTSDTFLKLRPSKLAELAEDEKILIPVKRVLQVISYTEEKEYYRIILKNSINGKDTWFVRKEHIEISDYLTYYYENAYIGSTVAVNNNIESYANFRSSDFGGIEVEEEVIKRLKAQLQETPTVQERSSQPVDITKDLVDCSVFSPASITPDDMFLVQVFVHLPEQVEFVKQNAQQFDPEAKQLGVRSLGVPIKRGSELTFNLSIPKLEVDEPIQQLSWNGRADSIQFGVTVPADITQKTVIGTVTVSQNTIPLGHLKFKVSIITSASSTSKEPQLVLEFRLKAI